MAEKKQTRVQKIKALLTGDAQKNALDFDAGTLENMKKLLLLLK